MAKKQHPIDALQWRRPEELKANAYNPNHVFGPELELLKISILEDGWTMPIIVQEDLEVVDGFHRYTLGLKDADIREASGGLVPTVMLTGKSLSDRMLSTIRHNRARGQHGILKMGDIVRTLEAEGISPEEIERRAGMEPEERERLADLRGSPEVSGKDSFGRGWVPTRDK